MSRFQGPQAMAVAVRPCVVAVVGESGEGVGALGAGAENSVQAGDDHEDVELVVACEVVEVFGGSDFRGPHRLQLLVDNTGQGGVSENTSGVDDCANRGA